MVRAACREARFGVSEIDVGEDDRGCGPQDDERPVETGAVYGERNAVPASVVAVADEKDEGRGEEAGPGDHGDRVKDVLKQSAEAHRGRSQIVERKSMRGLLQCENRRVVNGDRCLVPLERSR